MVVSSLYNLVHYFSFYQFSSLCSFTTVVDVNFGVTVACCGCWPLTGGRTRASQSLVLLLSLLWDWLVILRRRLGWSTRSPIMKSTAVVYYIFFFLSFFLSFFLQVQVNVRFQLQIYSVVERGGESRRENKAWCLLLLLLLLSLSSSVMSVVSGKWNGVLVNQ